MRFLFCLFCLLVLVPPASSTGYCMANCSRPTENKFCRITADVCAYPGGDNEAYMAVRSLAIYRMKNDDYCIQVFSRFVCGLYFPLCRYRITVPLCWDSCYTAFKSCAASSGDKIATARCSDFVMSGQVAAQTCVNGVDTATQQSCSCFAGASLTRPEYAIHIVCFLLCIMIYLRHC